MTTLREKARQAARQHRWLSGTPLATIDAGADAVAVAVLQELAMLHATFDPAPFGRRLEKMWAEFPELAECSAPAVPETPKASGTLKYSRESAHATFNGGWHDPRCNEAFHHGMDTVFNLIDAGAAPVAPPAQTTDDTRIPPAAPAVAQPEERMSDGESATVVAVDSGRRSGRAIVGAVPELAGRLAVAPEAPASSPRPEVEKAKAALDAEFGISYKNSARYFTARDALIAAVSQSSAEEIQRLKAENTAWQQEIQATHDRLIVMLLRAEAAEASLLAQTAHEREGAKQK